MFENGLRNSSICPDRNALISFIPIPGHSDISEHPLLERFVRGVFNCRPPQLGVPKLEILIACLDILINLGLILHHRLNNILSLKLVTLLTILCEQRVESIPSFSVDHMILLDSYCTFIPSKLLKQSRSSYVNKPVTYRIYPHNSNLCPVKAIRHYNIQRNLFIFLMNLNLLLHTGDSIKQHIKIQTPGGYGIW